MSRFAAVSLTASGAAVVAALALDGSSRTAALLLIAGLYSLVVFLGVNFIRLELFLPVTCRVRTSSPRIALTFDDGPDPEVTPRLLELLADRQVPAAFFVVGSRARACPDIVRRAVREGHLVGNHSFHHAWWTNFLVGGRLNAELELAQRAIADASGVAPAFYRPPMGLTNPHLEAALEAAHLTPVGWDVGGMDQRAAGPGPVVARIVDRVRNGSIILLHDAGGTGASLLSAVAEVIDTLRSRGFQFVRLDELLEQREPVVARHRAG